MSERKIVSYTIVSCHVYGVQTLVDLVNQQISKGFQPYGSAFSDSDTSLSQGVFLYQPMVKYED